MMMLLLLLLLVALNRNNDTKAITGRENTAVTTVTHSSVNSAAQITLSQYWQ